jgi:hypothetical protein
MAKEYNKNVFGTACYNLRDFWVKRSHELKGAHYNATNDNFGACRSLDVALDREKLLTLEEGESEKVMLTAMAAVDTKRAELRKMNDEVFDVRARCRLWDACVEDLWNKKFIPFRNKYLMNPAATEEEHEQRRKTLLEVGAARVDALRKAAMEASEHEKQLRTAMVDDINAYRAACRSVEVAMNSGTLSDAHLQNSEESRNQEWAAKVAYTQAQKAASICDNELAHFERMWTQLQALVNK